MSQKICIFAQNAGMSLSMTLILCFLASVCPPHVRLHGGPSASPCLMPFRGEQRVFLQESPDPQLSCNAQCGICQRPALAVQQLRCCPLFGAQSCAHPASAASRGAPSPALREGVQDQRRGFKPKTNNGPYFLQMPCVLPLVVQGE